jgi:hypothetical protein
MRCLICNKDYNRVEFLQHLFEYNQNGGGTLRKDHEISSELRHDIINNKDTPCPYCNGDIAHRYFSYAEDDVGWEIECVQCGFLFDED